MTHLELVEKLRSVTDLSYEQAKAVLERNNWDILDAMIDLEQQGVTDGGARYSTAGKNTPFTPKDAQPNGANAFVRAMRWCRVLLKKSCRNTVAAVRRGETVMEMPILVSIILLCTCFWILVPLMIVGLFFDLRYTMHGPDATGTKAADTVAAVSDKAADIAEGVKERIGAEIDKHTNADE